MLKVGVYIYFSLQVSRINLIHLEESVPNPCSNCQQCDLKEFKYGARDTAQQLRAFLEIPKHNSQHTQCGSKPSFTVVPGD